MKKKSVNYLRVCMFVNMFVCLLLTGTCIDDSNIFLG